MISTMQNPTTQAIAAKFVILRPLVDERARRLWAAVEARAIGRGGISCVAEATGLSRVTIRTGVQELVLPGTVECTPLSRPFLGQNKLGSRAALDLLAVGPLRASPAGTVDRRWGSVTQCLMESLLVVKHKIAG